MPSPSALERHRHADAGRVRDVLLKARELKGLEAEDVAALMSVSDPDLLHELFDAAQRVKQAIYGRRLVIFAPLYVSNLCGNECTYCAFRARNTELERRALTQEEIAGETRMLIDQGHKRVLLVAGESYPREGFSYVLKAIDTVYSVTHDKGEIRRINVNVAPLTLDQFRELKAAKIGTYQLFQETYHRGTYASVHLAGKKKDYDWRVTAMDRAMEAGIDDVGIGVLFGLFDWRYELLALMQHIRHLEARHGVGPHTLSVPRLEPATGSDVAAHPPHAVSDIDFRKIVAILRLAVPYTGIIMSTRESAHIRRETFALGVSQISAGSRTNPGGYADSERENASQFCLGDHRPWTRSSATWPASGTSRRSARPATGSGGRDRTSWTWPSRARSRNTATRTRWRPSSSTSSTTARRRHAPWASSSWSACWSRWGRCPGRWPPAW